MIFKQWKQVMDSSKTQTRRPVKESQESNRWDIETDVINEVIARKPADKWGNVWRPVYALGKTYAVQPGRGKKAVGRIRITKIRREGLGMLTEADARAEGCHAVTAPGTIGFDRSAIGMFADLWNDIYGSGAWDRMCGNDVWVLEFEPCEE